MSLFSQPARRASLMNDYGSTHGPNSPASFACALAYLDPDTGVLTEMPTSTTIYDDDAGTSSVVANGYARATGLTNNDTNFPPPATDSDVLTTPVLDGFPSPTAEYPETATHWVLIDEATGDWWDACKFATGDEVVITAAGEPPRPVLSIFYNDLTE